MDIVTYEIIRNSLYAAAREMKIAMMRTAGSPLMHASGDSSAAIFDANMQLVAQGKAPAAHKGLEHVAKVMAGTAVDVLTKPELLAQAKADHAARTAAMPDVFPIPKDVPPPLDMAGHA